MSEWQSIETAPTNTIILIKTESGFKLKASYEAGFLNTKNKPCWGWVATTDKFPSDWDGGTCWEVGSNMKPSDQPKYWKRSNV